jgi:hypothetical protein
MGGPAYHNRDKLTYVCRREVNRHLHSYRDRVSGEHEALELVMPALVMGDGLQRKVRDARRKILLLYDLDTGEVKGLGGL